MCEGVCVCARPVYVLLHFARHARLSWSHASVSPERLDSERLDSERGDSERGAGREGGDPWLARPATPPDDDTSSLSGLSHQQDVCVVPRCSAAIPILDCCFLFLCILISEFVVSVILPGQSVPPANLDRKSVV